MGVVSRKIFPACGSMCICCPALRSRSRQPVKRYKKLLAEIFPKSLDGPPSERKIVKLCEYAAKNPFRIPKIVKYLEERCYKELRHGRIKFVNIVAEAYHKLLCICKEQMAYFAVSLLNVVTKLLENSKQDAMKIIGCQTLTRFIYSQADGTYTHNIENLVLKVCALACEKGDEHQRRYLRASSLQCLSAMIWFMAQFSHILVDFDEIIYGILDNYEPGTHTDGDVEREEPHHNWVDEVIRCEGRSGAVPCGDTSPSYMITKPQPEKKDPLLLTREEIETPRVWAQICIQRMVELAKESTTMRRILDPIFTYFDSGRHWVPRQGLAVIVLSDMSYFVDSTGNKQLILASLIRHLDHKNVSHDPQLKSYVIQAATTLARQIRSGTVLAEIGFVCDLCRHLRKSLQATVESVGEQEANTNILLHNSIEDCLLEIAKGIGDAQPLFDLMAITLEKLPSGVVAKATIEALMILAHTISVASLSSRTQQIFPEGLLFQLLKVMSHPDVEARVGAHQIFSALLIPSSNHIRHGVASLRSSSLHQPRRWHSNNASASITALLEKLRREKDGFKLEKHGNNVHDDLKERDMVEEDWKQGRVNKNSPNFYKISSIVDRNAVSTSLSEAEPHIMKFNEEQIALLLSAFWMQASLSDNLPSNFEAISHSFVLALISSGLKNPNDNLVVRFFQLSLSLRNKSLDSNDGMLPPACQRSIFVLSTGMLMFAAKIYHILGLSDMLKSLVLHDVDPYIGISDDHQVYVKPQTNIREYGSASDNQLAAALLSELRNKIFESNNVMMDILVQSLCRITELEADALTKQLSVSFTPDDAFLFGPQSILEFDHNQMVSNSKKSLSFDGDFSANSLVEDDAISEASVADLSCFIPKVPPPPMPRVISIGQLLESALEVAGQVAGTSVTTSPLAYNTMASQCEALGTGTRKKLSNWLAHENHQSRAVDKSFPTFLADGHLVLKKKITSGLGHAQGNVVQQDPWLAMRLPPASPFDNFLKAARG
ncbi:protein SEMI-ROLLED LEAF 2-like [Juglans microcarpa x Juglans regia]|uniref:protein SEMI-ROLLED LEAF 2-like n=1 Tax=Juglans microcarpa x Juglans regia TaxID=2249226 RepID=UPI001B7E1B89|nr:protein SEMI-ROLLED LEAF 2-like [Juglans microcarpa x Juglans regia]XP_041018681.1 protein SEMI-ROLLED LEAF 2-like [Juglans microcarpa x Juglans regia]XP_041018682.1 protein SEMI-ROLLED LEAF 2-like [Juglans microcarpa x Juglans regia]